MHIDAYNNIEHALCEALDHARGVSTATPADLEAILKQALSDLRVSGVAKLAEMNI